MVSCTDLPFVWYRFGLKQLKQISNEISSESVKGQVLSTLYAQQHKESVLFLAKTMAWHSFPPHNQSESSLPIDFRIGLPADLAKIRICLYVYISLHGPLNSAASSIGIVAFFQQDWIFYHMSYSSLFKSKTLWVVDVSCSTHKKYPFLISIQSDVLQGMIQTDRPFKMHPANNIM